MKSGLYSPSTASLPAFSSLTPNTEERDLTLRPSCTLGHDAAITADSTSTTGTTHRTFHQSSSFYRQHVSVWVNLKQLCGSLDEDIYWTLSKVYDTWSSQDPQRFYLWVRTETCPSLSLCLLCWTVLARCSATQDIRQRCSDPCLPIGDAVIAEKRKATTVSSPKRETPLSPEWSTLRKKTEDSVSSHLNICLS